MRHLAPYQTGLWLAEYINIRCQLCTVYRSTPQWQLSKAPSSNPSLSSSHSFFANTRKQFNQRFSSGLLCARCHNSIAWLPTPFAVDIAAGMTLNIQAATYYDYPMRQAIRAFKHHEDMTKLPLLLHALRQMPRPHGCHQDNSVIVAMPTTDQRLVQRGFDPVSILATHLSQHWHIPLWQGVKRIDNTVSQQGLTRAERLSNLDNAFALIETPPVKRVILFDDVATTGASLQALARAVMSLSPSMSIGPSTGISKSHSDYHLCAYALAHGSHA
jgi:ComF family protein